MSETCAHAADGDGHGDGGRLRSARHRCAPYSGDGSLGPSAEKAQDMGRQIEEQLGLPVEFWDERLTTAEAHSLMADHNVNSKKRRQVVDKIAASLILQAYLDAHPL